MGVVSRVSLRVRMIIREFEQWEIDRERKVSSSVAVR